MDLLKMCIKILGHRRLRDSKSEFSELLSNVFSEEMY
jgi:hypothetical protein